MRTYLSFETPVADIEARLDELRAVVEKGDSPALAEEISKLEAKAEKALVDLYASLTPWQKTQVARAQGRPRFSDYVKSLLTEFVPLAGDRYFGEDEAIVGGLGRFEGESVCVLGQEKGDDTDSRLRHNFGMARPEGYRKATRLMELADRFGLPVISLVDTAGAFPGVEAEERGQAEARSRDRPTHACHSARPTSRLLSARADRAARSPLRPVMLC
jgi:acetyl-CoA carboxylase carboxyl transferase subunit alpha